jgi:hypothetical protein
MVDAGGRSLTDPRYQISENIETMKKSTSILPENILRHMSAADRKSLGKGGLSAHEAIDRAQAKGEAAMQRQFASYCSLRGLEYLWHRLDRKTGATPGWPDFLVVVSGKVVFIEFKTSKGRLSDDQQRVQLALQKAGLNTLVTTSASRAIEFVKAQEQKSE